MLSSAWWYGKKIVPTWNCSLRGRLIILSNPVVISGQRHCCWVILMYYWVPWIWEKADISTDDDSMTVFRLNFPFNDCYGCIIPKQEVQTKRKIISSRNGYVTFWNEAFKMSSVKVSSIESLGSLDMMFHHVPPVFKSILFFFLTLIHWYHSKATLNSIQHFHTTAAHTHEASYSKYLK